MAGGKIDILVDPDFTGFGGKLQAGLAGSTGIAANAGRAIGLGITAGAAAAAVGFKQIIDLGKTYEANLNTLQAVTGATGDQMARVGQTAQALGSDLALPATSAADAAAAMTELAKGGLSVDQAMSAAKGTLQLAAAAQIDAAQAATIQSSALNAFGLSAENAGRVADVLANTANASAVEITDMAQSLQAGGATANQFGVSIEDTATALGIFGNAGIKGADAGTLLKSMLLGLVNQSKPAQAALQELGVSAFDAQGKFVGLPALFDQLRDAAARMTPQQYAAATATAFGSDAARAAGIAAGTSSAEWDKMSAAVGRSGGAADVAAAKTKGLGGAIEGFKSQLETVALNIYSKISPALEDFVRSGAEGLPKLAAGAGELLTKLAPIGTGFKAVVTSLSPVAAGIRDVVTSGSGLGIVSGAASVLGGALQVVAAVLGPVASLAGAVLSVFSSLPGPIQAVAIGLLALKVAPALLGGMLGGLRGVKTEADGAGKATGVFGRSVGLLTAPIRAVATGTTAAVGAVRGFGQEMKLQQSLAAASGASVGKLSAATAAFSTSQNAAVVGARNFTTQVAAIKAGAAGAGTPISTLGAGMRTLAERSPGIAAIGQSFTTAAAGATRFSTTAGAAAAVGTTVKVGLGSLVSFLGGPWGVALAGAGVALGLLGSSQQEAAGKAAEHKAKLDALAGTLDKYSGAVTAATVSQKGQELAADGTLAAVSKLGISTTEYTRAALGQQPALQKVGAALTAQAQAAIGTSSAYQGAIPSLQEYGITLEDMTQLALGSPAAFDKVKAAMIAQGEGAKSAGISTAELRDRLTEAGGPAADLGRKLGISAAEVAKLAETQRLAAEASADFDTALQALGPALAGLQGGVAPTQQLQQSLDKLAESAKNSAQAAADNVIALGGNTAAAAEAGRKKMEELRKSFIDTAHAAGLPIPEAEALANKLGLIPSDIQTQITTNAAPVAAQINDIVTRVAALPPGANIEITAPTAEVQNALTQLGLKVEQIPGTKNVKVSVDDAAAKAKATALTTALNGIKGMAVADANITTGLAKGQTLKATIDAIVAMIAIDGNPAPGTQKANELKSMIDGIIAVLTADANTDPATQKAKDAEAAINALRPLIPVDADLAEAEAQVNAWIKTQEAKRVRISIMASGGLAAGGIVPAQRFASGGMHSVRKMRGGFAQMVPPNSWRIVGDRARDDEAYIPINRSRRSRHLLGVTAQRMGFELVRRYAEGGIAEMRQMATAAAAGGGMSPAMVRALTAATGGNQSGPLVNTLTIAPQASMSANELADSVMFRLRYQRVGGLHRGR